MSARIRFENPLLTPSSLAGRASPLVTWAGSRLWATTTAAFAGGRHMLTPMFLVLLAIGTTDLLFALDSIPAVFGITEQAYIVFTANAFALLGLRALYFLVSGLLDRLVYLSTGLSVILAFIGAQLVLHYLHLQDDDIPEISTALSLVVIAVVLLATTVASLVKSRRDPTARAHAGTLRERRTGPDREP